MSRIGKNPVTVPDDVSVKIAGQVVTARGKLGELTVTVVDEVEVSRDGDNIVFRPRNDSIRAFNMWGTSRSIIKNLVTGVSVGYTRNLEINGVGYRAQVQDKSLVLQLGFSYEVNFPIPDGIDIKCPDQTHITVSGANKQQVGQTAAEIRQFRRPEPYKGKGVKYEDEYILRKEGKKK